MTTTPPQPRPSVRVVHVDHEPYDLYIGRFNQSRWLVQSPLANPAKMASDTPEERARVVDAYRAHFLATTHLQLYLLGEYKAHQRRLPGKTFVLGCWCKGPGKSEQLCHGDVLKDWLEQNGGE